MCKSRFPAILHTSDPGNIFLLHILPENSVEILLMCLWEKYPYIFLYRRDLTFSLIVKLWPLSLPLHIILFHSMLLFLIPFNSHIVVNWMIRDTKIYLLSLLWMDICFQSFVTQATMSLCMCVHLYMNVCIYINVCIYVYIFNIYTLYIM